MRDDEMSEQNKAPAPAPEQERRERQRRCNHAWRGKTPKCKWGKCTWVPFEGRITRAYADRRKSQPKPSATSVEEIALRAAQEIHDGYERVYVPTLSRKRDIIAAAITEVLAAQFARHNRLFKFLAAGSRKVEAKLEAENARLRELLSEWRKPKPSASMEEIAREHATGFIADYCDSGIPEDSPGLQETAKTLIPYIIAAITEASALLETENARLAPLQESFNQCCDENARLREALEWFCERVDKGEVRSRRTYKQFKELLARTALKI